MPRERGNDHLPRRKSWRLKSTSFSTAPTGTSTGWPRPSRRARAVAGTDVQLLQVAETLPLEVLEKMGAIEAKKAFAHIPVADPKQLAEADAIIFGIAHPLRQHGRADARLPRPDGRALGQGRVWLARRAAFSPAPARAAVTRAPSSASSTPSSTTAWSMSACRMRALSLPIPARSKVARPGAQRPSPVRTARASRAPRNSRKPASRGDTSRRSP